MHNLNPDKYEEVYITVKVTGEGNYSVMQRLATKQLKKLYKFDEAESYGIDQRTPELVTYKYIIKKR